MAVYFAPKRQDYTLGIIDLLGRHVLGPMMDRTSQAKKFEYEQRLLADQDARKVAEAQRQEAIKKGFLDQAANGIRNNPHQQPGSADFIPGMVGAGANMKDLQPFWIPQQEQIDLGGTKMSRPIFPDGQGGEGQSFDVTMTPQQIGMMDIAKQELALKDWKTHQEAAQGWAGVSNANRNANSPHYTMNGDYVDANGNVVMIDTKTGAVKTLPGIVKRPDAPGAQQNPMVNAKLASEIYKNVTGSYPSPATLEAGDPIYKYILANMGVNGTPGTPTDPSVPGTPNVVPQPQPGGGGISPEVALYMKYRPGVTPQQAQMEINEVKKRKQQDYRFNK